MKTDIEKLIDNLKESPEYKELSMLDRVMLETMFESIYKNDPKLVKESMEKIDKELNMNEEDKLLNEEKTMAKKTKRSYIDCVYDMPEDVCEAFSNIASNGEDNNGSLINWEINSEWSKNNANRKKVDDWLISEGYTEEEYVQIKWWW